MTTWHVWRWSGKSNEIQARVEWMRKGCPRCAGWKIARTWEATTDRICAECGHEWATGAAKESDG